MTHPLHILADRVEGLSGPCRETDALIAATFDHRIAVHYDSRGRWRVMQNGGRVSATDVIPAYTASLDSAASLVPEGWRLGFEEGAQGDRDPCKTEAWAWPFESSYDPDWQLGQETQHGNPDAFRGWAATSALAITASCLRAIAANQESGT